MKTKIQSIILKPIFFAISVVLVFFIACDSKKESALDVQNAIMYDQVISDKSIKAEKNAAAYSMVAVDAAPAYSPKSSQSDNLVKENTSTEKKIIKDGNISIDTKNISESKKQLDGIIKQMNAYYDKEELQNNDQLVSYSLTIRIPSKNFEKLISAIENGKDKITYKSINARDVTDEFIDTKTRLENKKAYMAKYKELLKKASTIKDMLEIQNNIRDIQEEIESKEARLKYLNDQVDLSTLELYLENRKEFVYKPQEQDSFLERVKKSLSTGLVAVVDFTLAIISFWPIIIVVISLSVWLTIAYKNRKSKK